MDSGENRQFHSSKLPYTSSSTQLQSPITSTHENYEMKSFLSVSPLSSSPRKPFSSKFVESNGIPLRDSSGFPSPHYSTIESKGSSSAENISSIGSPRLVTETGCEEENTGFIEVPQPLECLQGTPIPPFLSKTYDLVDDPSLDPVISWGSNGDSFVVWDPMELARIILPKNFKHNNFSSFVRQLNTYGFRKVDTDRWEFSNEEFLRGQRHLLKNIHRRRSAQGQQSGSHAGSSIELGRPGLEIEIDNLKRDRRLLMQELVKLQQEHRGSAHQVEAMKQRMDAADQRQKQMVSFLAKLLQNPTFLTRLQQMHEQKEIASPRVKRKFVQQQKVYQSNLTSSKEGQIVKYKPDSGKASLSPPMQNLESNSSKQLPEQLGPRGQVVGDVATDELDQELVEASDQIGKGGFGKGFMDYENEVFKGTNPVSSSGQLDADYFFSFPEDLAKEKTISGFMSPGAENIIKQEDMWNMGFDTSVGMDNSNLDAWDNLFSNNPELGVTSGLSDLWDLGSQQAADGLGVDNWQGDLPSFDDFETQPGHHENGHSTGV